MSLTSKSRLKWAVASEVSESNVSSKSRKVNDDRTSGIVTPNCDAIPLTSAPRLTGSFLPRYPENFQPPEAGCSAATPTSTVPSMPVAWTIPPTRAVPSGSAMLSPSA